MKKKEQHIQQQILAAVRSNYASSDDFLSDLGKLLGLSRSGLYSKLNGRTSFNFNEVLTICRYYKLSLDYYVYQENIEETPYSFLSDALRIQPEGPAHYLENIYDHLTQLDNFKGVNATYLAHDIPLFYYIQFPTLMAFKLYVWNITNWKLDADTPAFDLNQYIKNKDIWSATKKLNTFYQKYPSREIWHVNMFSSITQQIQYFLESGSIREEDAIKLIDQLQVMIEFFKKVLQGKNKLAFGKAKKGGDLEVLLNETMINSEMINITTDSFNALYILYDIPNYMRTYDPRICSHASNYIEDIISYATPINGTGRKDRMRLIEKFISDVDALKKKI